MKDDPDHTAAAVLSACTSPDAGKTRGPTQNTYTMPTTCQQ